jgi:acyl-CoA thioesterase-1
VFFMPVRRSVAGLLAVLLTFSLAGAAACNKSVQPSEANRVIAFGDSLVYGVGTTSGNSFVSLLSQRLSVSIVNAGFPGDTTGSALARLKASVLDRNPSVVIVLLGGNDLLQSVPLQQRISNITSIATQIRATGAAVILVGLSEGNVFDPYEGALPGIASQTSSTLVPGVLDGIYGDPNLMSDSVHPNDAGHKIMADRIEPALRTVLKK